MASSQAEPLGQEAAVDTHCHLFLMEENPGDVVAAAGRAGVGTLVCAGIDPRTSRRSIDLAESLPGVFATAGMHPHTASELDAQAWQEISQMVAMPRVVAVGECGLDFYRMRSSREDQERAFGLHISLSRETELPVVVHVRDAWPDALRLLDEGSAERVVLHCFSGDASIATECAARGWYLSFAGNLTYPKNQHLREAAGATPLDRILVETDSPFLSPQALRGRDNSPANVVEVIREIATVRATSFEVVRDATSANARAVFHGLR
jgi:TatD DNase family protein